MAGEAAAARAARVVYGALLASLVTGGGVLVAVREAGVMVTNIDRAAVAVLRGIALALVVIGAVIVRLTRARIQPPRSGEAQETWWVGEGRRAFVLWSVTEGVGLAGAVFYLLTGDLLSLIVPFVWAMLNMTLTAPSRLTGN